MTRGDKLAELQARELFRTGKVKQARVFSCDDFPNCACDNCRVDGRSIFVVEEFGCFAGLPRGAQFFVEGVIPFGDAPATSEQRTTVCCGFCRTICSAASFVSA